MARKSTTTAPHGAPDQDSVLKHPDMSVWVIWAVLILVMIAVVPIAIRNQDMVRAFMRMCGFDID